MLLFRNNNKRNIYIIQYLRSYIKQEDWKRKLDSLNFEDEREFISKQRAYERTLVEAHMKNKDISNYDIAERELAEQGKIFGKMETIIGDVKYGEVISGKWYEYDAYKRRKAPRVELGIYEKISRRGIQEFNQRNLKPLKIVFPNVHPDIYYDAVWTGSRNEDKDGLWPNIQDIIKEFNGQNETFAIVGGDAKRLLFGYKTTDIQ